MTEPALDPDSAGVLALQRALAAAAFQADAGLLVRKPLAFAAAQGLGPRDQAAWARQRRRLLFYRDSVREGLLEPIEQMFPLTWQLLDQAGAGQACRRAFLACRAVQTPFHRDIAPSFLGWLVATGWGLERWPFLTQLAHSEILQNLVRHHPGATAPTDLHPLAAPGDLLVLDPTAQLVAYDYPVHRASLEEPVGPKEPVRLLVHRDSQGLARWAELTPATAALLVRGQNQTIAEASRALGLADQAQALDVLQGLREQGAILGFRAIAPP